MEQNYNENYKNKEKYILVAVATGDEEPIWESLDELDELLKTAGAEGIYHIDQNLPHPDRGTYVGSGKAYELNDLVQMHDAAGIICDDELSPAQLRNLSEIIDGKILDRTMLILDIFASHARTKEGKVQVEIAQLRYRMTRLRGIGAQMDRLGAGIGTRGPGETKLETDRRVIQKRIKFLSNEIENMKKVRNITRKRRSESMVPTLAIVGYTNAGKSTLLNKLTDSEVLSENKLFATLDPTTRSMYLKDGQEVLLTDTVGFINKLPHNLVDAFRSTLEESKYADMILQVIDVSDPQAELHMEVVDKTLRELDTVGKPIINVWNKIDKIEAVYVVNEETGERIKQPVIHKNNNADANIEISAKNGVGINELCDIIGEMIAKNRILVDVIIPYEDSGKTGLIRKYGQLLLEDYQENGVHIKAYVPKALASQLEKYL